MRTIQIVFDGPPSHESGRFVEVEENGRSINFGEWRDMGNGYWALEFEQEVKCIHLETCGVRRPIPESPALPSTDSATQPEIDYCGSCGTALGMMPDARSPAPVANSVPAQNTDVEIWRKVPEDFYSPRIHVTKDGSIGINVGGVVYVATVEMWHEAMAPGLRSLVVNNPAISARYLAGSPAPVAKDEAGLSEVECPYCNGTGRTENYEKSCIRCNGECRIEVWDGSPGPSAERMQVQLAGCSVAAMGWAKDTARQGDYGWSVAYQDVLDLRMKYDALISPAPVARVSREEIEACFMDSKGELTTEGDAADAIFEMLKAHGIEVSDEEGGK